MADPLLNNPHTLVLRCRYETGRADAAYTLDAIVIARTVANLFIVAVYCEGATIYDLVDDRERYYVCVSFTSSVRSEFLLFVAAGF